MSETKIVVPDGMLKAAEGATRNLTSGQFAILRDGLEAALRWLSEHPVIPSADERLALAKEFGYDLWYMAIVEWQRRMFLAPEPEIPEEIKELLWSEKLYSGDWGFHQALPEINKSILEAFRRGQKAGLK